MLWTHWREEKRRRSSWRYARTLVAIMITVAYSAAFARIIRISPTGTGGGGDTWISAYPNISTALAAATAGDTLWVRGGTYEDNVLVQFNVRILGGFSGTEQEGEEQLRDPEKNATVLDGMGKNRGLMGCVSTCVVDGLVLRKAKATSLVIYSGATPTIANCRIEENSRIPNMNIGGGALVSNAAPTFDQCVITGNTSDLGGGGVSIEESSTVTMTNCMISNNSCYGGAGGGIACTLSTLIMENCMVTNNHAYSKSTVEPWSTGGGIVAGSSSVLMIRNCLIANNQASGYKQVDLGGGWHPPTVSLENCTLIGNESGDVHWATIPPVMNNCIIWGAGNILFGDTGQADISYSCIQGGYTGLGNISDDPLFRNAAVGDYRLLPESPCIDTAGTSGPDDDLNGNPRPVDIAGIGREVTDTYDMGAYEFQLNELPTPTEPPAGVNPRHTGYYQ